MHDDVLANLREREAWLEAQIAAGDFNVRDIRDGVATTGNKAEYLAKLKTELADTKRQIADLEAEKQ